MVTAEVTVCDCSDLPTLPHWQREGCLPCVPSWRARHQSEALANSLGRGLLSKSLFCVCAAWEERTINALSPGSSSLSVNTLQSNGMSLMFSLTCVTWNGGKNKSISAHGQYAGNKRHPPSGRDKKKERKTEAGVELKCYFVDSIVSLFTPLQKLHTLSMCMLMHTKPHTHRHSVALWLKVNYGGDHSFLGFSMAHCSADAALSGMRAVDGRGPGGRAGMCDANLTLLSSSAHSNWAHTLYDRGHADRGLL